jgi:hypothetical protein
MAAMSGRMAWMALGWLLVGSVVLAEDPELDIRECGKIDTDRPVPRVGVRKKLTVCNAMPTVDSRPAWSCASPCQPTGCAADTSGRWAANDQLVRCSDPTRIHGGRP